MKLIIGIDDTDNRWSRGTGYRARCLGQKITEKGLGKLESITRHQLLVDRRIPYTSHNSSASLVVDEVVDKKALIGYCKRFLKWHSALGSDVGLCVAELTDVQASVIEWGNRAKKEILKKDEAYLLAKNNNIFLQGLTGRKIGVIGSLAAAGLRAEGNDGRLLWLKNMRELVGVFSAGELLKKIKIDKIITKDGLSIPADERIYYGEWSRPVNINKNITLIVEEVKDHEQYQWQCASKDYIKSISQ